MHELHFITLAVPRIAAFEETTGHAHDHRRRESIRGSPTHRAAIIQLLHRGIGVLTELNLRHWHQARERHADGAADDAFFRQARIEHARGAELFLQAQRGRVHAALATDVLTEHNHARD